MYEPCSRAGEVIFGTAVADREVTLTRYKPKSNAALSVALGGLPEQMRVEVDADIGVSASTVGQLRQKPVWPDNLVITTPQEVYAESVVRVSKISHATRISPKP